MKARDRPATTALRATLAAIDNAEAVTPAETSVPASLAIEQLPVGAGATEVPRRTLTEREVEQIVQAELAERETAAIEYDRAGHPDRAEQLRSEARALAAHLPSA
jgi:hypothetical protein